MGKGQSKPLLVGILMVLVFSFNRLAFAQTSTDKIAFVKADNLGNNANIWFVNADGNDAKQITTDNDSGAPCWLPDGRLAFGRNHQIHPKYGNQKFPTEIWAMNPDGSQPEKLLSAESGTNFLYLACSPKEPKIAYTLVDASGVKSIYLFEIGKTPQKIASQNRSSSPSFTTDGQRIFFTHEYQVSPSDDLHDAIFSIALDGSDEKLVFDDPMSYHSGPVISPDGTRLAFYRSASRNVGIHDSQYLMLANADGSAAKMFRPDFGGADQGYARWDTSSPDFSQDSKELVFEVRANKLEPEATPETSNWEQSLWVASVDAGKATKLDDGGIQPAWQRGEVKTTVVQTTTTSTVAQKGQQAAPAEKSTKPTAKDVATAAAVGVVASAASALIMRQATNISGRPSASRAADLMKLGVVAAITFIVAALAALMIVWKLR